MALVNPNIAMSYRAPDIQPQNMLADYAAIQQIQGGRQAQELNALKMQQAQKEVQSQNALSNAYAQSFDPTSGKLDYNKLTGLLAQGGQGTQIPGILKQQTEEGRAATEEAARRAKLMQDTESMYRNLSGQITTKADAAGFLKRMVNDPAMKDSPIARIPLMDQVQRIPEDPQGLDNWVKQFSLGATKYITENKPSTFAQDNGAGGRVMSRPGLGGAATVVPGSEFTKTPTIGERTAQDQLSLAERKFKFEQANPGYEFKQDSEGNEYGINKRTLQAVPVMVGGAAPMGGPGIPGPRAAQPGAGQVIPGMTSVLDQPALAAAPSAGGPRQFQSKVKETALTESQGNATAYGMRMKEANAILEPLEKAGRTNTGLISGAVGGTVGLIPFIGEKLEGVSGSVFNALPQILGGLSPEQQQVAQARINFITAILRKESGAAIGANEFATAEKNYFPKPGDDAAAIAQKQQARKTAIKAMEIQAGPGARQMGGAGVIPGASATNPLGLPGL